MAAERQSSYSVIGLAKSGVAAANALHVRGHQVVISDLRDVTALAEHLARLRAGVEVVLGENVVREGDLVVVSPGIPPRGAVFEDARAKGCEVIGEIALFQRLAGGVDTLAVTGTDGKSTTTCWLGEMLRASGRPTWVGGNLGTPLCASLEELTPEHAVVAEVSCFQLWTSEEWHPAVAVITNIAPDHLGYYDGSYDRYKAAKRQVMANLGAGETAVLNADDPTLVQWRAPQPAVTRWFSRDVLPDDKEGVFLRGDTLTARLGDIDTALVRVDQLQVPGVHNVENAMAAACAALSFGLSVEAVRDALQSFAGLEHRIERVRTVGGVTFYNDSKATNPHAGEAALRSFSESFVLIAGGSKKGSDFEPWADLVADNVRHAVLCGDTAERIAEAIDGRVPITTTKTLEDAVTAAYELAGDGGVVVLSPACASFDQFRSFEHRGEVFKGLVANLSGN